MEQRTLLDWLIDRYPQAKRTTFRRMLADARVRVNGALVKRLNHGINAEDKIVVHDRAEQKQAKLSYLVHEDADVIVVNKPTGLLTSTGPREKRRTLLKVLEAYLAQREPRARLGLIHRLDRDAAGLLVFSKSDAAYRSLKAQFFHHTVTREYTAVVRGAINPPAGRIESFLIELSDGKVVSTKNHAKGQRAITDYRTVRTDSGMSLLKVTLQTGRKHQIRVHLSEKRTPIVGDATYGDDEPAKRLMLMATRLGFEHPRTGRPVEFSLPLPSDFAML